MLIDSLKSLDLTVCKKSHSYCILCVIKILSIWLTEKNNANIIKD